VSYLAFSNFALAPFICLQLSILLPSCRRVCEGGRWLIFVWSGGVGCFIYLQT